MLAGMPAMRRQRMHARVAQVLTGATGSDASAAGLGTCSLPLPLVEAGEVLPSCRAAAEDSERRFSSETAAQWYEAALQAFDLLPEAAQTSGEPG